MLGDWNNKILCWFDYENELLHAGWKWPWFSENFRWDSDSKSPGYVFQNPKYNRSVSVLVKKKDSKSWKRIPPKLAHFDLSKLSR